MATTTVQDGSDKFAVVSTSARGRSKLWAMAEREDAGRLFEALKVSKRYDFSPESGNHLRVLSWPDWLKARVRLDFGEEAG